MSDTDVAGLQQTVSDLLMRVELLETRVGFCEDYIRDLEARREAAENPDAERSFRHA